MNDLRNEIRERQVVTLFTPIGDFQGEIAYVSSHRNGQSYQYDLSAGRANGLPAGDIRIFEEATKVDENNLDFYIESYIVSDDKGYACQGLLSRLR